jgi:hypothetical protein
VVAVACLSRNRRTGAAACPYQLRMKDSEMTSRYHSPKIQTINSMLHFHLDDQIKHYKMRKEEELSIKEKPKY